MQEKISVAIATYNGGKYLREQLDSLYSQTIPPVEIVVCDDCSKDNTCEILDEYKQKYGLRYYVNEKSLGVNDNFLKAVSLCTSPYIAICDQDDIWLPNKIEKSIGILKKIENGLPAVVSSQCYDIDEYGNDITKGIKKNDSQGYTNTLLDMWTSQGCSLMFNVALRDRVLSNWNYFKDVEGLLYDTYIAFTAAILGTKYNIGERLMKYRHHTSNVFARSNIQKLSTKERIKKAWRYPRLMPDYRIEALCRIKQIYSVEIKDKEINRFLQNVVSLNKSTNILFSGAAILKFTEYKHSDRFNLLVRYLTISLAKFFI